MTDEPTRFVPKGDLPEWRMIYDELLTHAEYGELITIQQLDAALGRAFTRNRAPLYRAREHLGEMRHRWVESVPGIGYRVIEAIEHLDAAQQRKRRAKRQLQQMVKIAEVTDLSQLSEDQLVRFDSQAKINAAVYMALVHHEQRLTRLEEILRADGKL